MFDGYLGRNPEAWRGFTPLTLDLLGLCFDFDPGEGNVRRGKDGVDYRVRALARRGFDSPFLFHFADDRLGFIENDYWSLDPAICAEVTAALGSSPVRLDAEFRGSRVIRGEWLYPERGLALCVIPETGAIARWTAFMPMPVEDYVRTIRPVEPTREFVADEG